MGGTQEWKVCRRNVSLRTFGERRKEAKAGGSGLAHRQEAWRTMQANRRSLAGGRRRERETKATLDSWLHQGRDHVCILSGEKQGLAHGSHPVRVWID